VQPIKTGREAIKARISLSMDPIRQISVMDPLRPVTVIMADAENNVLIYQ